MGRPCRTCADPRREEIDSFLGAGKTIAEAARRFDLPVTTIRSHLRYHARKSQAPATGDPVVDALRVQLRKKMAESLAAHDFRGVAMLARERRLLLTDLRVAEVASRARLAVSPFEAKAGKAFLRELAAFFARELPEHLPLLERLAERHGSETPA